MILTRRSFYVSASLYAGEGMCSISRQRCRFGDARHCSAKYLKYYVVQSRFAFDIPFDLHCFTLSEPEDSAYYVHVAYDYYSLIKCCNP